MKLSDKEKKEIIETDFRSCYQCYGCSGICPVAEIMDVPPHHVVRMMQLGLTEKPLECSAIWVCVGCNTCVTECPMLVNIPLLMDILRQLALKHGIEPREPDILRFHREVLNSIKKYGRTHKLEIMMRYKISSGDLTTDVGAGIKMLLKRKLNLTPSKVKKIERVRKMFK